MEKLYNICIIIGILVPMISLITDFFGHVFEIMNIDLGFHIDIGNIEISIIPTSGMSICAGLLLFGTSGKLLSDRCNGVVLIISTIIIGYIAAVLMQNLIRMLRKVDNEAKSMEEIKSQIGKVIVTIPESGLGVVAISNNGSSINYSAKSYDGIQIKQEELVIILKFEKKVAIVEPCNSEIKKIIKYR